MSPMIPDPLFANTLFAFRSLDDVLKRAKAEAAKQPDPVTWKPCGCPYWTAEEDGKCVGCGAEIPRSAPAGRSVGAPKKEGDE